MSNLPLSEQWYRVATEWTDLENAASMLEECKSAVLAQRMLRHGDIPVSRAETLCKGDMTWQEYLERMVKARTLANKKKIEMEYLRMKGWENQSQQATERTQARL